MNVPKMLVVDSSESSRGILRGIFQKDYVMTEVDNDATAIKILEKNQNFDVVIIDLYVQGVRGIDLLVYMKKNKDTSSIPVVVSTANDNEKDEIAALNLGAADFVRKPFNEKIVKSRIDNIANKYQYQKICSSSKNDLLTGIYNKEAFNQATSVIIAENSEKQYAIICFDIVHFKVINELFGMEAGNNVLKKMADSIASMVKGVGTYGRLRDDNFAVCIPYDSSSIDKIFNGAKACLDEVEIEYSIVLYMGVYIIDEIDISIEQMCDRANLAINSIKGDYKNRIAFYDGNMRNTLLMEQQIIGEMGDALVEGQFCIYLQPIFSAWSGKPISAEALVRWMHPVRGLIAPGTFIPIFEKNGFIALLDNYVLEETCKFLRKSIDEQREIIPISVNISRKSLYNPNLCDLIIDLLEKYDLNTSLLKIEITESAYTEAPELLAEILSKFHRNGFQVMMDDFGSGYSSLNMLKDLPVDVLKIDMEFLSNLETSSRAASILNSVVRMAKWLEMSIIAEGVETKAQVDFLSSIGCDRMQGYYYSKPLPCNKYNELIARGGSGVSLRETNLMDGIDIDALWDYSTRESAIISSMLGAMGIYEMFNDTMEIVRVNDAYYEMTGSTPQTIFYDTKDAYSWIYMADRKVFADAFRKAENTGKVAQAVIRRYHQNGSLMWIDIKIQCVGKKENRSMFCGIFNDITKQMSSKNDNLLHRYANMLSGIYTEVFELNYTDRISTALFYNEGASVRNEIMGLKEGIEAFTDLLHPQDRATLRKIFLNDDLDNLFYKKGNDVVSFKARVLRQSGKYDWITGTFFKVNDCQGKKIYLCCINNSVLPEKALELGGIGHGATDNNLIKTISNGKVVRENQQRTILIVDDNYVNRIALRHMLEKEYQIIEAENGRQALEIFTEKKGEIEGVLLDIVMPIMDGYEFLIERRKNEALLSIPVIVLSQSESRESEVKALELGANDFLRKPYEPLVIRQRLKNTMALKEIVTHKEAIRTIINNIPGGIMLFEVSDKAVRLRDISDSFGRSSGYSAQEYFARYGDDCFEMVHPIDRERVKKETDKAKKASMAFDSTFRYYKINGDTGWASVRANFACMDGDLYIYYAIATDITEQKNFEEKLLRRTSEMETIYIKQRIAFKQANLKIWDYNLETGRVEMLEEKNCGYNAIVGIENGEEYFRRTGIIHPDYIEKHNQMLRAAQNGEKQVKGVIMMKEEDEKYRWKEVAYVTIFDENNIPEEAIGVAKDVTEEIEAKQKYQRESSYRKSLSMDALAFVEFDMVTGELIRSDFDVVPQVNEGKEVSLEELYNLMMDKFIYFHDKYSIALIHDSDTLLDEIQLGVKHETYLECRAYSISGLYEGYHWVSINFTYVVDEISGHPHVFVDIRDINDRKIKELELREEAQRDPLTGLFNRGSFKSLSDELLKKAKKNGSLSAFFIIDIDDFKAINDTYGHVFGDEVLCGAAKFLKNLFRPTDIVGRLGGDEMVIFMPNMPTYGYAYTMGLHICEGLKNIKAIDAKFKLECSIGISVAPENGEELDTLYHKADIALYKAKQGGKNCVVLA